MPVVRFLDSNSADVVADLYGHVLVPLVDRHDLALLFTAHHRKSGGRAGTDDAVNGSVQWAGQAEQTITVAPTGPLTFTAQADSSTVTRRPFVLRRPKGRTLVDNAPEHFEVRGKLDDIAAWLGSLGLLPAARAQRARQGRLTRRVVLALSWRAPNSSDSPAADMKEPRVSGAS